MSRTIKAKRYNTFAACIRRSIWNDIAHPRPLIVAALVPLAALPTAALGAAMRAHRTDEVIE
ncbi:MAG TPA: hypothetical protein VFO74_02485 [Pseudolabrys sp.]|nr:hypothetical protein [Pseudolabrys sp.]